MSAFECPVVRVRIESHPNADAIEIAKVGDFQSIVKKGQFNDGDLAVYLPEASVLPEWLLKRLGFWNELNNCGTLNGSAKNRIKAIKLRGILSQGVVLSGDLITTPDGDTGTAYELPDRLDVDSETEVASFAEGEDCAEFLGVVKYEPTIPAQMAGRALGANMDVTHNYDFENIKKHPGLFEDGEDVVMTEKIHGTLLQICVVPASAANEKFYKERVIITSKGLGGRGIILDHNDESNVYAQAVKKFGLLDKMYDAVTNPGWPESGEPVLLFGEVFGAGVQDLGYLPELSFRAFDLCVGVRGKAKFCPYDPFVEICESIGIPTVPELYRGPFSKEAMLAHTDGKETVSGDGSHIREGLVVKTAQNDEEGHEARHPRYGRKIAKSISDAYLLRKNATEFN